MNGQLSPAAKKAYEVSYALFRIAAVITSRSFAELLEYEALQLLRNAVRRAHSELESGLQATAYMVSFGKDIGVIHPENAALIISQLESLANLAVLDVQSESGMQPIDLSAVFSETAIPATGNPANVRTPEPSPSSSSTATSVQSALAPGMRERQAIILARIRQSGSCRTSDLQSVLPELSERTLRYDLQRLVEQGIIERTGAGPASLYKMKEAVGSNVS